MIDPDALLDLARSIEADLECTTPGYGAPGHAHCAACCYGTGLVITNELDDHLAATAAALRTAATMLTEPGNVPADALSWLQQHRSVRARLTAEGLE